MQQDALLLKDEGDRLSRTQDYPGEMDSYVITLPFQISTKFVDLKRKTFISP